MTFISVGEGVLHSKSFIQAPYAASIMILVIRYTHCVYMSRAVVHFPSTLKTTDFIITQKSDHEFVSWYVLTDVHTSYIWSTMSQLTASLVKPPAMGCVGEPLWTAQILTGYSVLKTHNIKDKWPADLLINPDIPVYPGARCRTRDRIKHFVKAAWPSPLCVRCRRPSPPDDQAVDDRSSCTHYRSVFDMCYKSTSWAVLHHEDCMWSVCVWPCLLLW
mgnify:CR=1 FL=1